MKTHHFLIALCVLAGTACSNESDIIQTPITTRSLDCQTLETEYYLELTIADLDGTGQIYAIQGWGKAISVLGSGNVVLDVFYYPETNNLHGSLNTMYDDSEVYMDFAGLLEGGQATIKFPDLNGEWLYGGYGQLEMADGFLSLILPAVEEGTFSISGTSSCQFCAEINEEGVGCYAF